MSFEGTDAKICLYSGLVRVWASSSTRWYQQAKLFLAHLPIPVSEHIESSSGTVAQAGIQSTGAESALQSTDAHDSMPSYQTCELAHTLKHRSLSI